MTRINYGIKVRSLTDEHLLAEHREIKRIPKVYLKSLESGSIDRVPDRFCLGTGHVLFFIDKPRYTLRRYKQIHRECIRRGFNVEDYSDSWRCYPQKMLLKVSRETSIGRELVVGRIKERILSGPKDTYHYYGKTISKRKAIRLLYEYK